MKKWLPLKIVHKTKNLAKMCVKFHKAVKNLFKIMCVKRYIKLQNLFKKNVCKVLHKTSKSVRKSVCKMSQ